MLACAFRLIDMIHGLRIQATLLCPVLSTYLTGFGWWPTTAVTRFPSTFERQVWWRRFALSFGGGNLRCYCCKFGGGNGLAATASFGGGSVSAVTARLMTSC